jgi:hypothetical protein
MLFTMFVASLAVTAFAFEVLNSISQSSLTGLARVNDGFELVGNETKSRKRRSLLEAILLAVWPAKFDPDVVKNMVDVLSLLRRSGYPYATPGEFYAAAIRDFLLFLLVGSGLAAALVVLNLAIAAPFAASMFIFLGLHRPYVRLKAMAKKRAEGMTSNMLVGLTVMETLIGSSVSIDESLRAVANLGGPFCNLMALLLAQKNIKSAAEAVEAVKQHLPDPANMEVQLFLRDIEMEFSQEGSGRLGESIRALRQSLHRTVVENTETRAALVRQRAGLFGVLAVLGLVLTIVLPYAGVAF